MCLQAATLMTTEAYTVQLYKDTNLGAMHVKTMKIMAHDRHLA